MEISYSQKTGKAIAMDRIFIDVRHKEEYDSGHVPGAINLPPSTLMEGMPSELATIPKDTELVVYCLSGSRSNASIPYLKALGFTDLVNGINRHHVQQKYL